MSKNYSLTDLRTVHSRARTAWEVMESRRKENLMGLDAWVAKTVAEHERWYQKQLISWGSSGGRYTQPQRWWTPDSVAEKFPEWTADDQQAQDDLDAVVRQLDKYALPKKQVYDGV